MVVVALQTGCLVDTGPGEEQLRCYQACARDKDSCMLQAMNARQIQACDQRGAHCGELCR